MSRIRGKGNKDTEVALAKLFRANGITGWRRHYPIVGQPDFAFTKQKLAVFVDGCFWHGCPMHATRPKGNSAFWSTKLDANKARDRKVNRELRAMGWRVLRIWEHDFMRSRQSSTVRRVLRALAQGIGASSPQASSPRTTADSPTRAAFGRGARPNLLHVPPVLPPHLESRLRVRTPRTSATLSTAGLRAAQHVGHHKPIKGMS